MIYENREIICGSITSFHLYLSVTRNPQINYIYLLNASQIQLLIFRFLSLHQDDNDQKKALWKTIMLIVHIISICILRFQSIYFSLILMVLKTLSMKGNPTTNKETNGLSTSTCLFHGCNAKYILSNVFNGVIVGCMCKSLLGGCWCAGTCLVPRHLQPSRLHRRLMDRPQGWPAQRNVITWLNMSILLMTDIDSCYGLLSEGTKTLVEPILNDVCHSLRRFIFF